MPSKTLEAVKRKYPRLVNQLDDLLAYINEQHRTGITGFLPKIVSVKFGISEAAALGLLTALEDAGLLSREYHVLCKQTNALVATVKSLAELQDSYECDYCGKEHEESDVKVELVFVPSQSGDIENAA